MPAMKVILVKPSRYYSPDVVSAYHDEDDFDDWRCALGIGAGAITGGLIGARLGPWGILLGGVAGGIIGAWAFC